MFWHAYGSSSDTRKFFYSTPMAVAANLLRLTIDGSLPRNTLITGFEALSGFLFGNLIGCLAGLALWYSKLVAWIAKPYIVGLASLPVFAIAPMTVLWFGIEIYAKIALSFLATVFIAASQAFKGAENVDPILQKQFRVMGASRFSTFRYLLLPASAIWIISSLRLTIGASLLGAFIGEFIASDCGLGNMILRASGVYDTPTVLVGVLTMVALAIFFDLIVDWVEQRLLRRRTSAP
jgi:NitT/TauT family transport system permease protein